jgi:hypothetical protein
VGFEVTDGLEVSGEHDRRARRRADPGRRRFTAACSARTAVRSIGDDEPSITGDDGSSIPATWWSAAAAAYFLAERVINVGGLKVYPEVEAAINRHPCASRQVAQKEPMTGALVAADVVPKGEPEAGRAGGTPVEVKREILQICHAALALAKIPPRSVSVPAVDTAPPAAGPPCVTLIVTGGSRGLGLGIVRPAQPPRGIAPSSWRGT